MRVHSDWLLTPERAAIHLPSATAVIADVHLGYDQARCRDGEAVPAQSLENLMANLETLRAHYQVRRLVIAGDLLENSAGKTVLAGWLSNLGVMGLELTGIVPGNHDRGMRWSDGSLPIFPEGFSLDGWQVIHGDGKLPRASLVLGHFHPCLRWNHRVAAPCYLIGPRRIIVPAFSADAAGVNVLGDERWRRYRCGVIAGNEVLDFGLLGPLAKRRAKGVH